MAKRSGGASRHRDEKKPEQGQLRIIGGQWRGRKLSFHAAEGLRPTPDRIRETLFNWLTPWVPGSHCLDLFAGSGALGLEALSRGANRCQFVDLDSASCRQISAQLERLQSSDSGAAHSGGAEQFLTHWRGDAFDLVFVDPPFGRGLAEPALSLLHERQLLAADARVYFECGRDEDFPDLPPGWNVIRDKRAGAVRYSLLASSERNG